MSQIQVCFSILFHSQCLIRLLENKSYKVRFYFFAGEREWNSEIEKSSKYSFKVNQKTHHTYGDILGPFMYAVFAQFVLRFKAVSVELINSFYFVSLFVKFYFVLYTMKFNFVKKVTNNFKKNVFNQTFWIKCRKTVILDCFTSLRDLFSKLAPINLCFSSPLL